MSPEQKALFERAARLQGRSLTAFMIGALQEAAARAIGDREVLPLSARDSLALAEALLNPPAPNAALRDADRRYRELLGGRP